MNLHPLLVHFPIALWTTYAFLEVATLWWRRDDSRLQWLKGVLVIAGSVLAVPTILFGVYAEELLEGRAGERLASLIEAHEEMAIATFVLFALVALAYAFFLTHNSQRVALFLSRWGWGVYVQRVYDWKVFLAQRIVTGWWIKLLAAVGLLSLVVAGALGAAVAHGPDADAVVRLVVDLFGRQ